jgi:cytochrome c-type biogenesis protein CcmI
MRIIELFRDKLRELEAERKSGAMDASQYEQSRRDLERQLLDAVAGTAMHRRPRAQARALERGPRRLSWCC